MIKKEFSMKKYIVVIAAASITSGLLPTTGSICTNLNAYAKDAIVKQKMKCEGTGAGVSGPSIGRGLNAVGDRVEFTDLKGAAPAGVPVKNLGDITTDTSVALQFPYLGARMIYTLIPTEGMFAGQEMKALVTSYSLQTPPPATTPMIIRKRIGMLTTNKKKGKPELQNVNSVVKIFRRVGTEKLWFEIAELLLPGKNPGDLSKESMIIHPDATGSMPSLTLEFDLNTQSAG
jgi:hypothetical protein